MKLNNHQFGEQLELMGAHEIDLGRDEKPAPRSAPSGTAYSRSDYEGGPPESKRWSGPASGQYALGVGGKSALVETPRGPEEGFMHADEHGNYNEEKILGDWDPAGSIESIYAKHTRQQLMVGAESRPTRMIPADTPLHTLQPVVETESLYDLAHGPERRKELEASVAQRGVDKPILLVKHQDRHVVIDGHHRLLAARKAGHENIPVKIFDHDEHVTKGGNSIIEPSPQKIDTGFPSTEHSGDDDLFSLHDDLHSGYSHSGDAEDREPSGWT